MSSYSPVLSVVRQGAVFEGEAAKKKRKKPRGYRKFRWHRFRREPNASGWVSAEPPRRCSSQHFTRTFLYVSWVTESPFSAKISSSFFNIIALYLLFGLNSSLAISVLSRCWWFLLNIAEELSWKSSHHQISRGRNVLKLYMTPSERDFFSSGFFGHLSETGIKPNA